ncbi:MAG: type II toxin-antitoxin system HicB family antitoxin [Huintestinicola sp.]|uniref:type II toxin-antitoxin system HicB family antitoxin n=1 Tax=Huintestinicola sp. TaxID=2981661 RepID=UPI003EFDFAD4
MSKYIYPAIFTEESDGGYSIVFPDIPGCYTQGEDMNDGMEMANDILCLRLYDMEKNGEAVPDPSDIRTLQTGKNQFATLVSCDTLEYKKFYEKKAVKKTLSIPSWLNEMAEAQHINFSAVLQSALKDKLNVN